MEFLVGWPRVEIGGEILDWPQLKLLASNPERKDGPGEELTWIEDKILQFTAPDLPPGDYKVIIHDDKGPPGDTILRGFGNDGLSPLSATVTLPAAFQPGWSNPEDFAAAIATFHKS
jgi:hypothetical protein